MKKLLALFLLLIGTTAHATVLDSCIQTIVADDTLWQQRLFDKKDGVFSTLGDNDIITEDLVQNNTSKIYTLLAGNVLLRCNKDLANILKTDRGVIPFKHNNKEYGFDFSTEKMANFIDLRTGILVINKRNLIPGEVLELSSIPKKQKFFRDECSDWTIADNLDDDAAVNIAGQEVFNEFGGTKNEFFLDFAEGDNRRAFPGLVLMDKTGSSREEIVSYRNIKTGIEKAQIFANKLKKTACSNDGLAVYLVALDVKRMEDIQKSNPSGKNVNTSGYQTGWAIAAGVGGAATMWIGASAVATVTSSAATAWIPALLSNAMLATATTSWVPVVGWIAGALTVTAVTVASLYPYEIQDIQQVMILDGPYDL